MFIKPTHLFNQTHVLLCLLHWQVDFLPLVPPGKPLKISTHMYISLRIYVADIHNLIFMDIIHFVYSISINIFSQCHICDIYIYHICVIFMDLILITIIYF